MLKFVLYDRQLQVQEEIRGLVVETHKSTTNGRENGATAATNHQTSTKYPQICARKNAREACFIYEMLHQNITSSMGTSSSSVEEGAASPDPTGTPEGGVTMVNSAFWTSSCALVF
jgi:hypothetical protein